MVHALRGERNVCRAIRARCDCDVRELQRAGSAAARSSVRQAIAYCDRPACVDCGVVAGRSAACEHAAAAGHWAAASDAELPQYPHDPARAVELLDAAGLKPDKDGVRLRLTLKTSTDETTRLVAQAMQQELRAAGIALLDPVGGVRDVLFGCHSGRVPDVHAAMDRVERGSGLF